MAGRNPFVPSPVPFMHAQNDIFHQKCRLKTPRGMAFIALLMPWVDYALPQPTRAVSQRLYPHIHAGWISVTDYRHCVETQDRHPEGSKKASTPPYILLADQYCLQITVPISAIYYPIISYYRYLLRVSHRSAEVTVRIGRFWRFCSG